MTAFSGNHMDGKICVVTGATQGLGAAIARRLPAARAAGIVITVLSAWHPGAFPEGRLQPD